MERRTLLAGAGTALVGTAAGCTGTTADGETNGDDEMTRPESACTAGKRVIEATADGDGDRVEWLAPTDDFDDETLSFVPESDDWNTVVFNDLREFECTVEDRHDDPDYSDLDVGKDLLYTFEFNYDGETHEGEAEVRALKEDETWYAWVLWGILGGDKTTVDTGSSRDGAVEFILTELDIADGVYIDGNGIDRTDEYVLTEVGESVTVPYSWDEDRVDYIAYAYIGDPADPDAAQMRYEYGSGRSS